MFTPSQTISQKFPKTRLGKGVQRPSETIDQLDQSKPTVTVPGSVSKSPLRKQPWRKKEEDEDNREKKREKMKEKEEKKEKKKTRDLVSKHTSWNVVRTNEHSKRRARDPKKGRPGKGQQRSVSSTVLSVGPTTTTTTTTTQSFRLGASRLNRPDLT